MVLGSLDLMVSVCFALKNVLSCSIKLSKLAGVRTKTLHVVVLFIVTFPWKLATYMIHSKNVEPGSLFTYTAVNWVQPILINVHRHKTGLTERRGSLISVYAHELRRSMLPPLHNTKGSRWAQVVAKRDPESPAQISNA